jgi:hypothetical protein
MPQDVALQAAAPADRAMLLLMRGVDWARRNPTRTAAAAALLPVLWLVLSRAAYAGEHGRMGYTALDLDSPCCWLKC